MRRLIPALVATSLAASLLAAPATAVAAPGARKPAVQHTKSVPVKPVKKDRSQVRTGRSEVVPDALPKAGREQELELGRSWSVPVEGLSVKTDATVAAPATVSSEGTSSLSSTVAPGPVYRVEGADGAGDVQLRLDYSSFANAFGGDWAGRLRLELLDDCKDGSAKPDCTSATPLETQNDTKRNVLTAVVPERSAASVMTLAATAAQSGAQGNFKASQMAPSSGWAAGSQAGDFNWSYPLAVPSGVGDRTPDLALDYSSGSVDGRTSATNNQTSWVGEGFSLDPGFIERSYEPCEQVSGTPEDVGDLCWRDDNLSLSFNGTGGDLVQVGSSNEWRMKQDDGTRVERLTSDGINRDDNGEYWRVTTPDGTRHYFGRHTRWSGDTRPTDSVSTVPVYAPKSGQPCHDDSFASSVCTQAWRWSLDYVVDTTGNTISYFYDQETNKYGSNKNSKVREYDRAVLLKSIEYGSRHGVDAPEAKVIFTPAERCLPTDDFDCTGLKESNAGHWPDVPFDQICSGDSCKDEQSAPTFFSRKRLAKIGTYVRDTDGSFAPVNEWTLTHQLPATGDVSADPDLKQREVRTLWLAQVQQTGKAGAAVSLPPVKFNKQIMDNRVYQTDGIDSFARYRINAIDNGTGGSISINYSARDCSSSDRPSKDALDSNDRRCFPVWYQPWWAEDPQLEFFHKYRVDSVVETDNTGGAPSVVTSYTYLGGDGWHYTGSTIEKPAHRTWNEWRGYQRVRTERGWSNGKTWSESLYLRGMHGDRLQGGGSKTVEVQDPTGDSPDILDSQARQGFERRTRTQLGASGAVVDITVNTPWSSEATATADGRSAYITRVAGTEMRTRLSSGDYRTAKVTTSYNSRGLPTAQHDQGDTSTTSDDRCTTTTYAVNDEAGIFNLPATVVTTGLPCGTAADSAADIVSASRIAYDGGDPGDAPTQGNPTREESARGWSGGVQWQADVTTAYDAYGRPTSVTDAKDRTSTTAYAPSAGRPTSITTTNPIGQTTVAQLDPVLGLPSRETDVAGAHTSYSYDGLGRVLAVWGPGRDKATQTPTVKFAYRVSATAPNIVTTDRLNGAEEYVRSLAFYDGLMRERETQSPAAGPNGGRLITEKTYDDRGWLRHDRGPYFNASAVDSTLVSAAENVIPSYQIYTYDLAGRVVDQAQANLGGVKWWTTTVYGGDRVSVTPPKGGTATTTFTDVRGQTTRLVQHTGATASGAGDETTYTYTPGGQLATVTDSSGTTWRKTYDIRGRLVADLDPDKGRTTYTYDDLDQQVSTTDARGVTLWTDYDALGRKTALRDDSSSGLVRARWRYDTVRPGALTSSTRIADGQEYSQEVVAYDAAGRPTEQRLVLPASEGLLYREGGYVTRTTYNPDGTVRKLQQPSSTGILNENLQYQYDKLGNVTTLMGATTIVNDIVYSPLGEVLRRDSGSASGKNVYETRTYDDVTRRVTQRAVSLQGSATVQRMDLRYTYDPAGNVTRLNDVASGDTAQSSASTWRQCFTYDHLRRMTAAWTSSTTTCAAPTTANLGTLAPYADTYTYAKNGNRSKVVSLRKPSTTVTSTTHTSAFPAATAAKPHAATAITKSGAATGTESYAYDEVGNLAKRSTSATAGKSYEWDREGHVKKVTDLATSKAVEYLYDADGARLLERNAVDGSTTLYAGNTELKLKGTTRSSVRTYTLNGEAIATRDAAGLKHTSTDHHGTPLVSVNSATQALDKRRYTPFGELIAPSTAAWPSSRGYLNKTTDTSVGTVHLDAREYDAAAGRFISVDPIADFSDPQQLNGYAYANNSPVAFTDPNGLQTTGGDQPQYGVGAFPGYNAGGHRELIHTNVSGNGRSVRTPSSITRKKTGSVRDAVGGVLGVVASSVDYVKASIPVVRNFGSPTVAQDFSDRLFGADRDSWAYETGQLPLDFFAILMLGGGPSAPRAAKVADDVSDASRAAGEVTGAAPAPSIHWGRQAKHFRGHQNFTSERSRLTADPERLARRAGTGTAINKVPRGEPGFKELVDYGEIIGTFRSLDGVEAPTTRGVIHYSKDGIHIVPGRPAS